MAPALSSSFLPGQPSAKPTFRPPSSRSNPAVVYAKLGGGNGAPAFPSFRIGARPDPEDSSEEQNQKPKRKNPFNLDIGLGNGNLAESPAALVFRSATRRKDPLTVFVAGATGQTGARISRALLRSGFSVRAGVPDLSAAQEVARIAAQYKIITPEESRKLNAVESGFADAEAVARAIGNAAKVVVTVGRAENGPAGTVTTDDAFVIAQAAELAGVGHLLVIYDSGVGLPEPSTNNVLDGITSFFSNLFSPGKSSLTVGQLLEKIATETDVNFTLVKTTLTGESAAESGGLAVAAEGAGGGSRVSWSQIASLAADVLGNVAVAENKVVEVSAAAESRPVEELFGGIAEDGRRKTYKEAEAKRRAEEEALAASEKAKEAAIAAKRLEAEVSKLSAEEARAASLAAEARRKAEEAGASLESILAKAKGFSGDFSWDKLGTQFSAAIAKNSSEEEEEPKVQVATVRGRAKARALPAKKAVVKSLPPKKAAVKNPPPQTAQQPDVKKVFGGLFRQETIYVDDD